MQVITRVLLAAGLPWLAVTALAGTPTQVAATNGSVSAAMAGSGLTLEQAVAKVLKKTHGKVLRASSRQYGNAIEYRIKVLTPDGHVRVIPVRSRQSNTSPRRTTDAHLAGGG